MKPFVSDETLNAFVDGEFDVAESESLIARMRDDPELAQRVGTLRSLRSMALGASVSSEPDSASTGHCSSLASILRPREISPSSVARFSSLEELPLMSCK